MQSNECCRVAHSLTNIVNELEPQQAFLLLYLIKIFYDLYFSCAEMSNKPTVQRSSEKIKQTICRRSSEGGMSTCLIRDTMMQAYANHTAQDHKHF